MSLGGVVWAVLCRSGAGMGSRGASTGSGACAGSSGAGAGGVVRVRVLAGQNGSFLKAGLVQNRHFWALVRVRALGRSKTAHF